MQLQKVDENSRQKRQCASIKIRLLFVYNVYLSDTERYDESSKVTSKCHLYKTTNKIALIRMRNFFLIILHAMLHVKS